MKQRPHISVAIRRQVAERFSNQCAYCQTQARVIGSELEMEHIVPFAQGGPSDATNLCLACARCNKSKGSRTSARDPLSGDFVALFNPLQDAWHDHFEWDEAGIRIIGKSAIGRATATALNINSPIVLVARRKWVAAGWHPPQK